MHGNEWRVMNGNKNVALASKLVITVDTRLTSPCIVYTLLKTSSLQHFK